MTQIIFLLVVFSIGLNAYSMTYTCTHKGKTIDLEDPDVKVFIEGEVFCLRDWGNEKQKERLILSKGKKKLEEIDGPRRHELKRYTVINGNEIEEGEQVEYFAGTNKVQTKVVKIKGANSGLKETFFPSGKIKEQQYYDVDQARAGTETASIAYHENGKIQYLRCGTTSKNTIDSKLCGFEGASKVTTFTESGVENSKYTLLNGKKTETEEAIRPTSGWASLLQKGTIREPKAKQRKTTVNPDKSSVLTDLYENGKVKRIMNIDASGNFSGADDEWFVSGKQARHTVYGKSDDNVKRLVVIESQCWWENGKARATVARTGNLIDIQNFFDNGRPLFSGSYSYNSDRNYYWRETDLDGLISCDPFSYALENEGLHKSWNRDGHLQSETHYVKGKRHGVEKIYDKLGKLNFENFFEKDILTRRKTYNDKEPAKDEEFFADGSIKQP